MEAPKHIVDVRFGNIQAVADSLAAKDSPGATPVDVSRILDITRRASKCGA